MGNYALRLDDSGAVWVTDLTTDTRLGHSYTRDELHDAQQYADELQEQDRVTSWHIAMDTARKDADKRGHKLGEWIINERGNNARATCSNEGCNYEVDVSKYTSGVYAYGRYTCDGAKARMLYRGSWHIAYRALHVVCPDGKRRNCRITADADTFFTIPASVIYKGKTVSGFITDITGSDGDMQFIPYSYRVNGGLFDTNKDEVTSND